MTEPLVSIYIATINTSRSTELCISSLNAYTPRDAYRLHVCDSGSEDDSLPMLMKMLHQGVIDELTVEPRGRDHGDWLDQWVSTCPTRFGVAMDSDIEILRSGWLELLTSTALSQNAALVYAELIGEIPGFVDHTGIPRRMASRPSPWMMLFDAKVCRTLASWHFSVEGDETIPELLWGLDTGAAVLRELEGRNIPGIEAPRELRSMFRHYGGMSWVKALKDRSGWRLKAQALKVRALEPYILWRIALLRRRTSKAVRAV